MFSGFQGMVCALFGAALIGTVVGAICLRLAWTVYSHVATYHLRRPTLGNCFGIALAHLVLGLGIFFLLESVASSFRNGVLWQEILLGTVTALASFVALVLIARLILMTDYRRATIYAVCHYALMLPLMLLSGAAWWMIR